MFLLLYGQRISLSVATYLFPHMVNLFVTQRINLLIYVE